VIIESPVNPLAGLSSLTFFLARIQTAAPSAFEMRDTAADEAGVFYFSCF
jgi:hypothetical protein